ncbi:threonylcarbamoyl-AMP synthase [Allopusillimonas soli]|uniref:Threonylcarbamoyl-AMP synthase n=1 Tax=Allopusillimonas soli TaxID=659016 RepID=A0A853FCI3_9BURK|nr:L-threonylcarbamoyladenylate synthase [Allopusillimonas soli]NYT38505.1 threonylcarbamoyl-AMP synthase [Allopusillimonas soli]TEA71772.1 threonylcarbamoyl-AMP synthase [Allopusillimonas soli]
MTQDMSSLLAEAARRLDAGGLVAFPTETVYGLGADAENPEAIAAIYAAKGRPSSHPVIVHVAPEADLLYWAASVPPQAQALIQAFWPGPLTLILPRARHVPPAVSGGQDSVGLRCPSHPVAQALLRQFASLRRSGQAGVAGPSANKFGQVSPTRASHVRSEFQDLDEDALLVLEGGPSQVGIESTIVDVSRVEQGVEPVLLRPGHVTAAQLAQVLGGAIARPDAAAPRVSGSLKAHYAPRTPLKLMSRAAIDAWAQTESGAARRCVAVVFDAPPENADSQIAWRRHAADAASFAKDMYALLRDLDQGGYDLIVMEQPPRSEAWRAVNDRLGRAAAAFEAAEPSAAPD